MTIHLARHGQTAYNHEGRFQGHLPVPLDATGREQAAALAEVAAGVEIVSLCVQPAAPRARDGRHRGRAHRPASRWRTRASPRPTPATGRTARSPRSAPRTPRASRASSARTRPSAIPGGESFAEQSDRVQAGLADLRAQPAALPALVVCHRGVIRLALAVALGDEAAGAREIANASLVTL